jgi:release factor glutamine methyltransferase
MSSVSFASRTAPNVGFRKPPCLRPCGRSALWITQLIIGFVLRDGSRVTTSVIERLRAAGCVFAEEEAAILGDAAPDEATLDDLVRRRCSGEPLEQVVGYADFAGIRVRLRPGVFVPRVRSEWLVREGVEAARLKARPVVVDLCCGSGALGLAVRAQLPGVDLYAADVEPAAVACARENFGEDANRVFLGDLFAPLPARLAGTVDVLLANVPYVASRHIALLPAEARDHEPRTALDGGDDGLDIFRAVLAAAPQWLSPGGTVFSEITEAQLETAVAVVRAAGLEPAVSQDDDLEATVIAGRRQRR